MIGCEWGGVSGQTPGFRLCSQIHGVAIHVGNLQGAPTRRRYSFIPCSPSPGSLNSRDGKTLSVCQYPAPGLAHRRSSMRNCYIRESSPRIQHDQWWWINLLGKRKQPRTPGPAGLVKGNGTENSQTAKEVGGGGGNPHQENKSLWADIWRPRLFIQTLILPKGWGGSQVHVEARRNSAEEKWFSHQRRSDALLCDRSYNNQNYERLLFYVVSKKAHSG